MPPAKKTEPTPKPDETFKDLVPGVAVLLPDGGEAILVGIEDDEALLRCGTLHGWPIRRRAADVNLVDAVDETPRHVKFRREAVERDEIPAEWAV